MFTFICARRLFCHKDTKLIKLCSYLLEDSTEKMSLSVKYPWKYIYIAGPDLPIYLKRGRTLQNESESRISKNYSKLFDKRNSKYLLFSKSRWADSSCKATYVDSAIESHLAYRQKGKWPATTFSHAVFGSEDCVQKGVFCCSTSQEQHSHLHSQIKDFLKENNNFKAYQFHESSSKNIFKLSDIGDDNAYETSDDREIEVEIVTRSSMKGLQENDPVASPIFSLPEISPVFHSYSEARIVLEKLSCVPEVKELLDVTDNCITIATEKSCDQTLLHPFVVVEGMDATGKTTLTELLEKKMGAARYFTPPPQITHLRAFFDKYPEIVRRAYYSMGNYIVAREIIQECQSRPVIMDRFWHSTAAYGIANETSSGDMPEPDHSVYRWPSDLLKPTIVLFLTVSEDVRKQRLSGRGLQATFEEKSLDNDQLFRQRLCDAYRRMNSPSCIEIDAGGTVEEVQSRALQVLASHGVNLHCINK